MLKNVLVIAVGIIVSTVMMTPVSFAYDQDKRSVSSSKKHVIPGQSLSYLRLALKHSTRLNLSDKQFQQVGGLLIQAQVDVAKAHGQAEVEVAAFKSVLYSGKATAKDVKAYSKRMGNLREAGLSARLLASIRMKFLLNDEQRNTLKTLHYRSHAKNGKRSKADSPPAGRGQ